MNFLRKKDRLVLFLGDVVLLYASLWLALFARYAAVPTSEVLSKHVLPFTYIFFAWVIVFIILGLYEKRSSVERRLVHGKVVKAHIFNSAIAVAFFYFFTGFEITPKALLFLFLGISLAALWLWRWIGYRIMSDSRGILVIAEGPEAQEIIEELSYSKKTGRNSVTVMKPSELTTESLSAVLSRPATRNAPPIQLGIIDFRHENVAKVLPALYDNLFSGIEYVDVRAMYEAVFDRIPLSLLDHSWFLRNVSAKGHLFYDGIKRAFDIIAGLVLLPIYLVSIPFVWMLIKGEEKLKGKDYGSIFIRQERVGRANTAIYIPKFRTMNVDDSGKWVTKDDNRHTSVGKFLRKSRIDELPQVVSVLRGDLSFVGPRPDMLSFGQDLKEKIPYYAMRNVITPGLSGWAQIKQDYAPQTLEQTRLRLAYDFYYIKNRSVFLDLIISLRTIRTLLSRLGI